MHPTLPQEVQLESNVLGAKILWTAFGSWGAKFLEDLFFFLWRQRVPFSKLFPGSLPFFRREFLPLLKALLHKFAFFGRKLLPFLHALTQDLLSFLGHRLPLPILSLEHLFFFRRQFLIASFVVFYLKKQLSPPVCWRVSCLAIPVIDKLPMVWRILFVGLLCSMVLIRFVIFFRSAKA